jgi:3-phenylpropionate/trans-cinnamate dioxygenase alpha subunit
MIINELIDVENRTVSPKVFSDPTVYAMEGERVFGQSWLYVAHESQLQQPGAFVTSRMGDDPVITCRDKDNQLRVFINSCRHKGTRLCQEDQGIASAFTCRYHGWTYDLSGNLRGLPEKPADCGRVLKGDWGLIEVPRVESYRGVIFANFDQTSVGLDEYLGEVKWYFDILLAQPANGFSTFDGVHRWRVKANWKLPAEQFSGDVSHARGVHQSIGRLGFNINYGDSEKDFIFRTPNGHTWTNLADRNRMLLSEYEAKLRDEARSRLTPEQHELTGCLYIGTIFPNFALVSYPGFITIRVWQPHGPTETEICSWGLVPSDAPEEFKARSRYMLAQTFSPSGIFEQDDVEIWEEVSAGVAGPQRKKYPLPHKIGRDEESKNPFTTGIRSAIPSEDSTFSFHLVWLKLMNS